MPRLPAGPEFLSGGSCDDGVMSLTAELSVAECDSVEVNPQEARVDGALARLAELQGQRNAIDAQIVDVVADLAEDDPVSYTHLTLPTIYSV